MELLRNIEIGRPAGFEKNGLRFYAIFKGFKGLGCAIASSRD